MDIEKFNKNTAVIVSLRTKGGYIVCAPALNCLSKHF